MDPFGRPIVSGEGDAALAADTKQAALAGGGRGWAPAYGGRRQVGAVTRGGLLHNPFTKYGLPVRRAVPRSRAGAPPLSSLPRSQGVVLGFLLALFLASPVRKAPPGDADADARLTGTAKKKKQQWGGPAPPPGAELKLVLVVREDLGMSIGKTAAQCAHAAVGIVQKLTRSRAALLAAWEESGQTKVSTSPACAPVHDHWKAETATTADNSQVQRHRGALGAGHESRGGIPARVRHSGRRPDRG